MVALIIALMENPKHVAELQACFDEVGHDLLVVHCFAAAMNVLRERSFDLIISDVHLENGGTVYDFLSWTKQQSHLQATPFVLFALEPTELAKYLADGVRTTARALGAARFISMDRFDAKALRAEIADLLPEGVQESSKVRWEVKRDGG